MPTTTPGPGGVTSHSSPAPPPESGTNAKQKQAIAQWIQQVNVGYPTGWLESGGPIRTRGKRYGTRHVHLLSM
jgi:hypothetical protein